MFFYYVAWGQALVATAGSLFFSEVMHFEPCTLCWWQRIFMYPLVIILYIGIKTKDKNLPKYVLSMGIVGWMIAVYHNYIYYQTANTNNLFCSLGVSCSERYINWFGFVTIPLLSLVAYSIIIGAMGMAVKKKKE